MEPVGDMPDLARRSQNRGPMDLLSDFGFVVVHKSDDVVSKVGIVLDLPVDLLAEIAGADDQQVFGVGLSRSVHGKKTGGDGLDRIVLADHLKEEPDAEPASGDQKDRQEPVDDKNGSGKTDEPMGRQDVKKDEDRRQRRGHDDPEQVVDAGVPPHPPVQIEKVEGADFDHQHREKGAGDDIEAFGRNFKVEPQKVGSVPGREDEQGVRKQH